MNCEICGNKMDKVDIIVVPGAPKACTSCIQKFEQCKKNIISIDELITPNTSPQVKSALENAVQGDTTSNNATSINSVTAGDSDSESTIGKAIKLTSIIVMVLSMIGSIVIWVNIGGTIGFASLLVSLLTGLLYYGIGEICCLLTDIRNKLKRS